MPELGFYSLLTIKYKIYSLRNCYPKVYVPSLGKKPIKWSFSDILSLIKI